MPPATCSSHEAEFPRWFQGCVAGGPFEGLIWGYWIWGMIGFSLQISNFMIQWVGLKGNLNKQQCLQKPNKVVSGALSLKFIHF